jgi:hypothetical protein
MYSEFATDPKVQRLSESEQRRFVMVLCLRCGNGDVTLHDEDIVFQLRISGEEWQATKAVLIGKNLIDKNNKPIAWEKRQFISDSSASRVAKHRALQKLKSNDDVTLQERKSNALDTDTDTDTEKANTSSSSPPAKNDHVPYDKIVSLYHEHLPMCPKVKALTAARKSYIAQRWKSGAVPDLDTWRNFFIFVSKSKFLTGMVEPPPGKQRFIADLEWITKESNFVKIYERKYHGEA